MYPIHSADVHRTRENPIDVFAHVDDRIDEIE